MLITRYAVCSSRRNKPVTRVVCDTRQEAERALDHIKKNDELNPESEYWIAELGAECEAWRWLAP